MIIEIFSDEIKGRLKSSNVGGDDPDALGLADLEPLFKKMGLITPLEGEDVVKTSEGGYNLMLNQYGAVLRLYPTSRDMEGGDVRVSHGYHPRTIPPIGLVQFEHFALQIMPGVDHNIDAEGGIGAAMAETQEDTGLVDTNVYNYGSLDGKAKLLDTVLNMNFKIYEQYAENGILDRLIEEYRYFEDLQILFNDAWVGDVSFDEFWEEMERAKDSGRLVDGWNHSHLSMAFEKKGNIIDAAKAYEQRMLNDHEGLTF